MTPENARDTLAAEEDIKKRADEQLQVVAEKIWPAIFEIVSRNDSGPIVIDFHEGRFQRAKRTYTL